MTRNCDWCGSEYEVNLKEFKRAKRNGTKAGHFCSSSCAYQYNAAKRKSKKKTNVTCSYCGKKFYRKPSDLKKSKTGLYFCCREHKDLAQRISSGFAFDEMRPSHYKDGSTYYWGRAMKAYGPKCVDCGFSFVPLLQVHHIDGNQKNGDIKNLEVVCPTHHAIRHMRLIDGEWKFSWKYLTPREELDRLKNELPGYGLILHQQLEKLVSHKRGEHSGSKD